MSRKYRSLLIILLLVGLIVFVIYKFSQSKSSIEQKLAVKQEESTFLLTIFLRQDQSKNLGEIQKKLTETGFYKNFPPEGIEVEGWKVVMGIGQIITLKVPANKLRDVNVAIEKMAWGSFRTEFYPTYDFLPIYKSFRDTTSRDTTNRIKE